MTKFLHIKMLNKAHPYSGSPGADSEAWGRIILFHELEGSATILVDTEWDLLVFSEWFVTNKQALCLETLVAPGNQRSQKGESIAEAVTRLNQKEFSDDEEAMEFEWFDFLYQFNMRHNLWCSLMGNKIPNILLCCNNGDGEISFFSDGEKWRHEFDMNNFIKEVEQEIEKFLLYWKNNRGTENPLNRAELILNKLEVAEGLDCCKGD